MPAVPLPEAEQLAGLTPLLYAQLWEAALIARAQAYVPYSHFAVGAALLDEAGRVHAGCNVENAAYPQSSCAEASAISALVLAGGRRIRAALVMGLVSQAPSSPVSPCGGCRQRLREFAAPDAPIFMVSPEQFLIVRSMAQLLPHSFGPEHLASEPR